MNKSGNNLHKIHKHYILTLHTYVCITKKGVKKLTYSTMSTKHYIGRYECQDK